VVQAIPPGYGEIVMQDPHGKTGHLNIYVLDERSSVTNYGKHARVVACCPTGNQCYCRVDYVGNMEVPTTEDIVRVAKTTNGHMPGKWSLQSREEWTNGHKCEDVYLVKAGRLK